MMDSAPYLFHDFAYLIFIMSATMVLSRHSFQPNVLIPETSALDTLLPYCAYSSLERPGVDLENRPGLLTSIAPERRNAPPISIR